MEPLYDPESLKDKVEVLMMNSLPQNLTADYFRLKKWPLPKQQPKNYETHGDTKTIEVFVPRSRDNSEGEKGD